MGDRGPGQAGSVDLRAVKAASRTQLSACACAAARNAHGLLHDAEVLARSGATARAYSLAALAVEECGKALGLCVLAVLPKTLRTRAPSSAVPSSMSTRLNLPSTEPSSPTSTWKAQVPASCSASKALCCSVNWS